MAGEDLSAWIGRRETREDVIAPGPVERLAATLDWDAPPPGPGEALPPAWHWLYFLDAHRQSRLGPDGHGARGDFLPPVALPRRMWAGGRLAFHRPLPIGARARRVSEIVSITPKTGRRGALVFVTVRHSVAEIGAAPSIVEEHDIVYREAPRGDAPAPAPVPAPGTARWRRAVVADAVLLFRYSALTFNGHRIHYDRTYATEAEDYPGLVVHGPLIATLLLDLLRREGPGHAVAAFDYRARAPLFDTAPFTVCGMPGPDADEALVWAEGEGGGVAMEGRARFARQALSP